MNTSARQLFWLLLAMIRERSRRRQWMFFLSLVAMGFVAAGVFLMERWLENRPAVFLAFWGFCFLAVTMLILLSVYDMLRSRQEILEEARRLEKVLRDDARSDEKRGDRDVDE